MNDDVIEKFEVLCTFLLENGVLKRTTTIEDVDYYKKSMVFIYGGDIVTVEFEDNGNESQINVY